MGSRDSNTAFGFQSTNHLESYDWDAHGGVYYANRFRTQNHGISVSSLGVNMQSFRGEKSRIQLVFAISNREPVLIAPRPWNGDAGYLWASTGSLEVDALTTFYVGLVAFGALSLDCTDLPRYHKDLVDLGTWYRRGSDDVSDWHPTGGPRWFGVNFQFSPSRSVKDASRPQSILKLACEGKADNTIAHELGLSVHTIDFHWRRLREQYRACSRSQLLTEYFKEQARMEQEDREAVRDRAISEAWLSQRARQDSVLQKRPLMLSWPALS